ncbi:MAG: hypothetical protein A3D31_06800 [Candidatus Fluviicola riflensis]|nr:MAG: hypothetical protein CHH17_08210 [Candidatus Fluviicola riflensis]OGS79664.1 MAG: hypothetical protein A3D31_06800 [Candidatus Fluviicola riflensis]OGS87096.1 MAG: hypothetical protein A2724_06260 [Fluviicola sp. RIFCSPHIGHO2_01_FULL_43_53]OGS89886.1 MAG: hypothetical protein A3E30_03005 [Fluviicola sp. RIFCSPHIGHO2_12_FULL_43_24]
MAFKWKCPYCNHDTTINDSNFRSNLSRLQIENKDGYRELHIEWIVCPNQECNKHALTAFLFELEWIPNIWNQGEFIKQWNLIPQSNARVFPDYIPEAIRFDYEEACIIKDLSPKASATLSRRCLQGMIRDFYGVKEKNLFLEIDAIKDKVDPLTWKSIDATRKIGNIGAHMEKDINLIVDVDSKEAALLINLIEVLIKDWYIHRHERELMLNQVIAVAEDKSVAKNGEK